MGLCDDMEAKSNSTVYVGGFAPTTDASDVVAAFQTFGEIVDITLPPDPARNNPHRGFAFVTFADREAAHDAIDNMHCNTLPGTSGLDGGVLKVNLARATKGLQAAGSNKPSASLAVCTTLWLHG